MPNLMDIHRKTKERRIFLARLVEYVVDQTHSFGTRSVLLRGHHKRIYAESLNQGALSFRTVTELALSPNVVKVWYHPNRKFKEGMTPVLDIVWSLHLNDRLKKVYRFVVREFSENTTWQGAAWGCMKGDAILSAWVESGRRKRKIRIGKTSARARKIYDAARQLSVPLI